MSNFTEFHPFSSTSVDFEKIVEGIPTFGKIKLNINFGGAGRQLGPAVTKGGWGQLSQAGSCGQRSHVPSLVHFKKPSTVVLLLQFSVYNFTSSSRWPNQNQISVQHISARTSCWKLAITASAAVATAAAAGR